VGRWVRFLGGGDVGVNIKSVKRVYEGIGEANLYGHLGRYSSTPGLHYLSRFPVR